MISFIITIDASNHAIGGILSQVQYGQERNKNTGVGNYKRQKKSSTIEREKLAVVEAVNKFYILSVWIPFQGTLIITHLHH